MNKKKIARPYTMSLICASLKNLFFKATENKSMPYIVALICVSLKNLFLKATKNKGVLLYGLLCFMLFDLPNAQAQSPNNREAAEGQTEIKPLVPGQPIPEEIWNSTFTLHYFDGSTEEVKFNDFRGKAILLDFWSTGCVSCIQGIPKMEKYQRQYKDDLVVLLVNSKRNKDTPERIANRFKVYKKVNNYVPELPTILDDTIFTALLPHNTIPNISWINQDGIYLANTMSGLVSDKELDKLINTRTTDITHTGVIENKGRRTETPPIIDTADLLSISALGPYIPKYLAVYPNLIHKNGASFYQFINQSLSMMLFFAYGEELDGFAWNDYVFESNLREELRDRGLFFARGGYMYSYLFYNQDSVGQHTVTNALRKELTNTFGFTVERRSGTIDVYKLELTDKIDAIKTEGRMGTIDIQSPNVPLTYVNKPISVIVSALYYWLDCPVIIETDHAKLRKLYVDLTIPADFHKLPLTNRLAFLEEHGIKLVKEQVHKEYPVFIKQSLNEIN
ncbi:TlpA family protein disulfide reductase [Sphingobacterium sp. DN00404]|uniref:TlpA family protein disulfide reductase n=1 Tax=Sphingobacterium micropteri TaxID=2763501 RepID=A0ABR7YQY6_9SPHI|nr:TlpA disulfide reductase family protein [Sphingobacterium micropteri]MBD1433764.1 TlpA family protein disulfide reductase [Sphingobacterium micropteri]